MKRGIPSGGVRTGLLVRQEDETGISGTGAIGEVAIFTSGVVVLSWLSDPSSTALYASLDHLLSIHGHGGKTVFVERE